jgi:hypothetical protein
MSFDEFSNDFEFLGRKTIVLAKTNGFKPKLANQFIPLHMNMPWLPTIKAVKEQSVRT